jgi:phage terminase large subunit
MTSTSKSSNAHGPPPFKGSYYGGIIDDAEKEGRIARVEHDPAIPVHVAWDLGISDSCVLWFFQVTLGEVRIIDYYEHNNVPLGHYVKIMEEKRYWYGDDWLPHDAKVRELGRAEPVPRLW